MEQRDWFVDVRHAENAVRFHIDFLPYEHRLIRRDGIQLFRIHYWDNVLSPLAGRSERPFLVRYNPGDLSKIFVKGVDAAGYVVVPYRDLARPPITLMEHRAAMKELARNKPLAMNEENVFQTIAAQRALVERARHKTVTARRKALSLKPRKAGDFGSIEDVRETASDDKHYESSNEAIEPYEVEVWE